MYVIKVDFLLMKLKLKINKIRRSFNPDEDLTFCEYSD
jgi:hypothetical protein